MVKYVDTKVVFQEYPDEITLALNISNCPYHCPNCHSAYLAEDIGTELTDEEVSNLIDNNEGITCIGFMGGNAADILHLARYIKETTDLKVGWYTGSEELPSNILLNLHNFNYIKVGPYKEELGPLTSKTTNQRFYKVIDNQLVDFTYLFNGNKNSI